MEKDRGRSLFGESGQYGNTGLSDAGIEVVTTHEEIEGAFLPFQKDADQICTGWKEELTHTCSVIDATTAVEKRILFEVFEEILTELRDASQGTDMFLRGTGKPLTRHEEMKSAFSTFQKDVDQIYPGRKEKLPYTDEFPVQVASSDRAKHPGWQEKLKCTDELPVQAASSALGFVGAGVALATKEVCVASQALNQPFTDRGRVLVYGLCDFLPQDEKLTYTGESTVRAASFDRASADVGVPALGSFSTTSYAHKEFLDEGGINEITNDKLADEPSYEDVDKLTKVGAGIRDKITDLRLMISQIADAGAPVLGGFSTTYYAYKEFLDKGSISEFTNDQLAHESAYEEFPDKGGVNKLFNDKVDSNTLFDRGKLDLHVMSHVYKEFLDKGGTNKSISDKLADESICEGVGELRKVGKELRGRTMDPSEKISQPADVSVPVPGGFSATSHAYKDFLDKGGVNKIINDKLADDSFYEDVDKLMKQVGAKIRDKIMEPPLISQLADVGVPAPGGFSTSHAFKDFLDKGGDETISDNLADESFCEDVDKLMKQVGTKIRDKITDTPLISQLADVGVPAPGGFSTSHRYKDFLDKGDVNEIINDKLADDSIYEDVDKLMKQVGTEIRGKIVDPPLLADVGVPAPGGFSTTSHGYKDFLDKGGVNGIINDKLADDSIYEDVDKLLIQVGTKIRDKITEPPLISQLADVGVPAPGGFSTSHAFKDFPDKGGDETINDNLADESSNDHVDKPMKPVGTEIRDKITDPPLISKLVDVGVPAPGGFSTSHGYKDFLDKGGVNEIINDKLADDSDSIYEDVDKFTKQVGTKIRDKIMDPRLISQLADVGVPAPRGFSTTSHGCKDFLDKVGANEIINDKLADDCLCEDVDKLMDQVGTKIRDKITDRPLFIPLADVGAPAPGSFSTTSHGYQDFLDKGGDEIINDKLADDCIYEDVDKLMNQVGTKIRDKITDPPLISQLADVGVPAPGGFSATSHGYKDFLDKRGVHAIINDQLADDSIYEDVDKFTKQVGTKIRDNIMDLPLISQLADVGAPAPSGFSTTSHAYTDFLYKGAVKQIINDKVADDSISEDVVDKLMKQVGTKIRDKITDLPLIPQRADVGAPAPGGFSTMSHGYKDFLDTGGDEIINDKLADEPLYADVDKLMKVSR